MARQKALPSTGCPAQGRRAAAGRRPLLPPAAVAQLPLLLLLLLPLLLLPTRALSDAAGAPTAVEKAKSRPHATHALEAGKNETAAAEPPASGAQLLKQQLARAPRLGPFAGRKIKVCTSEVVPIVYCAGRTPDEFTGYEVELFWHVAKDLGWSSDNITLSCLDWDEMMEHLRKDDGVCDMAIGGIDISERNLEWGLTYTTTTVRSGYRILVSADSYHISYFVFLDAFDASLWIAILLTCVAVGVVLWLIDPWASKVGQGAPTRHDYQWRSLRSRVWGALANAMTFSAMDIQSKNMAGATIVLTFCFMMLVLMSLFTANTAANLTASRLNPDITGWQDLPGKKVATWEAKECIGDLARRGISAIGYRWNDGNDQKLMVDAVANGTVDALVLDSYVLEYAANSRCDVNVVGQVFDPYEGAFAFPAGFNDTDLLRRMDLALIAIKETGDMETLYNQFVNPSPPACKGQGANTNQNQLGFHDVMGLWIMLAGGVAVAIAITVTQRVLARSAPRLTRAVTRVTSRVMMRQWSLRGLSQLSRLTSGQLRALGKVVAAAGGADEESRDAGGGLSAGAAAVGGGLQGAAGASAPRGAPAVRGRAAAGGAEALIGVSTGRAEAPGRAAAEGAAGIEASGGAAAGAPTDIEMGAMPTAEEAGAAAGSPSAPRHAGGAEQPRAAAAPAPAQAQAQGAAAARQQGGHGAPPPAAVAEEILAAVRRMEALQQQMEALLLARQQEIEPPVMGERAAMRDS